MGIVIAPERERRPGAACPRKLFGETVQKQRAKLSVLLETRDQTFAVEIVDESVAGGRLEQDVSERCELVGDGGGIAHRAANQRGQVSKPKRRGR